MLLLLRSLKHTTPFALAYSSRPLRLASSAATSTSRISFLTDVEGDREYLERFVDQSHVLEWKPTNDDCTAAPYPFMMDFKENNDQFVFGGDLWDQGGADLFCLWQFTSLRERYPDRVHSVLGNRDVNKLRLWEELEMDDDYPGVHWLNDEKPVGDTKADRLRWILQRTMGSPRAFDYRKAELEQQHGRKRTIQDEDVVASYQNACHPETGAMIDHIEHSSLFLRLGQVAFLHGGLPLKFITSQQDNNNKLWDDMTVLMPWLEPNQKAQDVGVFTIDEWIQSLNDFAKQQVAAFRTRNSDGRNSTPWSSVGGYHQHKYGGGLVQYGMGFLPGTMEPNPTIVYNRWGSKATSNTATAAPREFWNPQHTAAMQEFFRQTKLRLICTGHQPNGDLPNTIRIDVDGQPCWILCCDTSYSGDTQLLDDANVGRGTARSGRGQTAVSEVILHQCKSNNSLEAYHHGTLSNGKHYRSKNLFDPGLLDARLPVGRPLEDSMTMMVDDNNKTWWVQAAFDDDSFALAAAEGFDFWRKQV